jgi:AcrR family transcriptional regulator
MMKLLPIGIQLRGELNVDEYQEWDASSSCEPSLRLRKHGDRIGFPFQLRKVPSVSKTAKKIAKTGRTVGTAVTRVKRVPRRTQAERREATRKLILDATVEVMARVGVAGLRMEDVERRADISRGALLHHFRTKQALMLATFKHVNDRSRERSEQRTRFAQRAGSIPEVVDAILADAIEFFFGRGFFVELSLGFGQGFPELRRAVRRLSRQSRFAVESAWRQALQSRGLPDSLAEDVLNLTLNQVRGFMVRRFMDDNPQQRARLIAVWQQMIRSYLVEKLTGDDLARALPASWEDQNRAADRERAGPDAILESERQRA